jgi:uncharacterized glyoxalase superfamily protein PhnB
MTDIEDEDSSRGFLSPQQCRQIAHSALQLADDEIGADNVTAHAAAALAQSAAMMLLVDELDQVSRVFKAASQAFTPANIDALLGRGGPQ